ncbi:mCG1045165 [Mus musculus]|nr:mCG1045165 [Mus musculus]
MLRSGTRKRERTKPFKCAGAPLTNFRLIELVKGISSGPSHCGQLCFTQYIHSSIAISLSLKIPSSTLSHGISGISKSFPVGHLLINTSANHSNKLLTPFLTMRASVLNLESLLRGPMSINSACSSFMFLPPLSHTLKIHSHTYSPGFCLNELANSLSSLRPSCEKVSPSQSH